MKNKAILIHFIMSLVYGAAAFGFMYLLGMLIGDLNLRINTCLSFGILMFTMAFFLNSPKNIEPFSMRTKLLGSAGSAIIIGLVYYTTSGGNALKALIMATVMMAFLFLTMKFHRSR